MARIAAAKAAAAGDGNVQVKEEKKKEEELVSVFADEVPKKEEKEEAVSAFADAVPKKEEKKEEKREEKEEAVSDVTATSTEAMTETELMMLRAELKSAKVIADLDEYPERAQAKIDALERLLKVSQVAIVGWGIQRYSGVQWDTVFSGTR